MGSSPDALTLIAHSTDQVAGNVSYTLNGFRAFTGLQSFRSYDWMTDVAATNVAGNFRGMVVSARWATAYNVISSTAKVFENVATVASLAATVMDMSGEFEKVYRSKDSAVVKAQKYSLLTSIVAQKTLAGIVTGPVHLFYQSLILGCDAVAKSGGNSTVTSAANVCSLVVNKADVIVESTVNYITDPVTQQRVIQNLVTIRIR